MSFKHIIFVVVSFFLTSCVLTPSPLQNSNSYDPDFGGGSSSRSFKVPVPPGYNWEITQSWYRHCSECSDKYSDWDYCSLSHSWNCCKYGWDFNLPGTNDRGKPVLSTSDGIIDEIGLDYGWGNYVVIDHGGNICSRYAHMANGSTDHLDEGQTACQGLKIGEIGNTGDSAGDHLHFQFEECDSGDGLDMRFTDGNGIPKCTRGNDVFNSQGRYDFLILSNQMVHSCEQSGGTFGGGELPEGGWYSAECGNLPGCPLIPNCGRSSGHQFTDQGSLSSAVVGASAYLYSECALDGKADGGLHPNDTLTRAEALKVPMFLYGLMENCGASEPFADVDQGDWYFGVVACAARYGIIDTVASYFRPNEAVEFAEAAKFVVEAASRAGVIDIQDPSHAHFPDIPKTHWAYEYAETIYYYGGIEGSVSSFSPGRNLTRGEYFIMVASLSPCYCRNVSCESGCECDQDVFSCVDPDNTDPGTGGTGQVPDVTINCYVDEEDTQCLDPDTIMQVECEVTNHGQDDVNVIDLRLTITSSNCTAIDDDYKNGVGYSKVEPGETKSINGHFEIGCLTLPSGGVGASIDLTHAVPGPDVVFPDIAQIIIPIPSAPFADCAASFCTPACSGKQCGDDGCGGSCGSCAADELCDSSSQCVPICTPNCSGVVCGWDGCGGVCNSCPTGTNCDAPAGQCIGGYQVPWGACDPAVGYTVFVESPGGSYEILTSGPVSNVSGTFPTGLGFNFQFDCVDLPAVIRVNGGDQFIQANVVGAGLPNFYFWANYSGPLVIDPPGGATGSVSSVGVTMPNETMLIRMPTP